MKQFFCTLRVALISLTALTSGHTLRAAEMTATTTAGPAGTAATTPLLKRSTANRLVRPQLPKDAYDSPEEAQKYFLSKRLAPGMTGYPIERLLHAQSAARSLPLYSTPANSFVAAPEGSLAAQSLAWTSLGPGNVGGRTRALTFVPGSSTNIFAAGVAGGVWKSTDTGGNWTPVGDAMANMAVTALLIDPSNTQVMYAGTGEGFFNIDQVRGAGIFKSTDGGVTWSQLSSTNNANFAFVNSLALKPTNSAVIYAATGNGLYRSLDSGASWTQLINATNANGCMKVVYRSDVDTAIASCGTFAPTNASNGIWRSTNASAASPTWTHIVGPTGSGATQALASMGRTSLAIAPSAQATVYALISCSPSAANLCGTGSAFADGLLAVYKSTDGGGTWSAVYTNTFSGNVVANLLLTNPEAQLCENLSGFNQGWYDNTIAVDPTNASRVFVSGIEAFRSDDGGATWGTIAYWWLGGQGFAQYAHADHHGLIFHPGYNGSSETRVFDINDGGIFVAADAATATRATTSTNVCPTLVSQLRGASWSSLNNGYGVTQYYHGTVYPSGTQYFGGAQDNGTTRGSDGSPNGWTEIVGGDGGWTAIDKNTSGGSTVLYAENTGISISKSIDNGASFSSAVSGITTAACALFINPFQMDPNNTSRLFTSNNVLWRTSNAAGSWTQASAAITGTSCNGGSDTGERFTNYAAAPGNSDVLVAGTNNGRICRLTNATTSTSATALQNCTQPAGAGAYMSEINFDPNNASAVYAVVSTFGFPHVWKSINSGQTWTNISGSGGNALPDSPTHTVAVSPNNSDTIYVGTEIGVFVTTDGGVNWARENTGFANVITDHLVFSPTGATGQQLYAFTHGRGTFRAPLAALATSTTGLASSHNPSVFGQSVMLTATVSGGFGTPTGNVTFKDGTSTLASNVTLSSGIATFSTSAFAPGSHSLSAVYSGDGIYKASTGTLTQTVNKASTTVSIGSDNPDASVIGQPVSVGATVAVTAPGGGTATGTITVSGTGTSGNCTITLPATSCNLTFTSTGAQTISATYNGDTSFSSSSTGSPTAHSVTKADTTVSIGSDNPDPSVFGQAVSVGASVAVTSPGAGTPTGSITISGSNTTGDCTITLPATSCNLTFTATGAQTINATYNGDTKFNTSNTGSATAHTVNKANTTVSIGSDNPDPSVIGQSVSVGATVAVTAPGSGAPTGSITVTGTHTSGTCTITLPATSCNLTFTAAGAQTISASYSGDTTFNTSSTGLATAHTVNKMATTLSIADAPDPTLVGASVTVTPTVGVASPGVGTPTGSISVIGTNTTGCVVTLPATSCDLSFTAAGAQTIDATYNGDANFATSSATQIGHTVTPTVDLSITKTDHSAVANVATQVTYSIVVSNAGPSIATGATVTDTPPAGLGSVTWTCTPTAPAACPHASGAGAISETVTLDAGQTLTYELIGTVTGAVGTTLVNTAVVTPPAGTADTNLLNNSATDTDDIIDEIFKDGFDP